MDEYEEPDPKPLPRWLTILAGLVLTPFTFFCVIGSSILLLAPNVPRSILTISLGTLFFLGSVWVFYLSLRLLFVSPSKSKFISSISLGAIALVLIAIPTASLILGTFWKRPILSSIMTIGYTGGALRLWSMAKSRKE